MFFIAFQLLLVAVLYLWLVNRAMMRIPPEVQKATPNRWTKEQLRRTYAEIEQKSNDFTSKLPKKLDRRYIVVGGSGLVGGWMVLHLLARGQSPESIRIIDFRSPVRPDLLEGEAAKVDFQQADISSEESTNAAFEKLWPKIYANLPLTVLHPAAAINFTDRARSLLYKISAVNLTGTVNVMSAAKKAGADVFISTSSASVALKPVKPWIWPWQKYPANFAQFVSEDDAHSPIRDHYDYFGNYAVSKAHAEKLVMAANTSSFRTGCIRPANGIYGNRFDHTVGTYLKRRDVPTWVAHIVQNFVYAENISIAHLLFEAALLSPDSTVGGRVFTITDPNPPIAFSDIYNAIDTLAVTPWHIQLVPPVLPLLIAYPIEAYCVLKGTFPFMDKLLPSLPADISLLQPTLFNISGGHVLASDAAAQRSVTEGGLGYKGLATSLEAMCIQIKNWNEEHQSAGAQQDKGASIATEVKNVATVAAARNG